MNKHYNVVIVGAGPAGSSCALSLRKAGLTVAVIDKSTFPRTKTCGDAIPGPSLKFLKEIMDGTLEEFDEFESKLKIKNSSLYLQNGKALEINWRTKAYNSTRHSFDDFLLNLVKKHTDTSIYEGLQIDNITKTKNQYHLKTKGGELDLDCDMLIGSDGANSIVSRTLSNPENRKTKSAVALSAYYENMNSPEDGNLFFFLKDILGYFWIFPVNGNLYNVGFGLLEQSSSLKIDLKKCFQDIVDEHPTISEKFKGAKARSDIKGFKLPLAGSISAVSGDRFLLTGDAAHLIDPLGGHGIDKAIRSGMYAANQVERCFEQKDFSSAFNKAYDDIIEKKIAKELKRNFQVIRLISKFPWLMDILFAILKYFNRFFISKTKRLTAKYKVL